MRRKPWYDDLILDLPTYSPLVLTNKRRRMKLTQIQISEICFVSVHTWRAWEMGKTMMPDLSWAFFLLREKAYWANVERRSKRLPIEKERLETPNEKEDW